MHVLHKHAHQYPHLSFPRVNPEITLPKPWVYPTQTPLLPRPIWKCINMQNDPQKTFSENSIRIICKVQIFFLNLQQR